jgi:4-hydroxybenzoate polyprenyltransferase
VTVRPLGAEATPERSASAAVPAESCCASVPAPAASDSAAGGFIFRLVPQSWHPLLQLARLDRPIGWWLLLLPCWWSSALASVYQHGPLHGRDLILFFVGAVAMRGAGSTYNDIIDRDVDAKVKRTKHRPLAAGRVRVSTARLFLAAQCLVGLAVLLCFNTFTIFLGCASLVVVGLYPFTKRISSWPQAVLGAAFAWGGLVGWSGALGSLAPAPLLLYFGAVFWTIGYDTIYAIQDIEDDAIVGIGSTARLFGGWIRLGVGSLYMLAVCCVVAALIAAGAGILGQSGLLLFALHLGWQTMRIDPSDGALALRLFRSNRDAGLLLFIGLAAEIFFTKQ